jgi:hypothetical protein
MLTMRVDSKGVFGFLDDVQQKQLPFAVSRGLNALARDGQEAERKRLGDSFHLRRKEWNLRQIYIAKEDRPTKTSWRFVIQIAPTGGYLEKFEEDGFKVPVGGRHYLWIPNDKVFANQPIKPNDPRRPKSLHLHKDPHGRIIGDERSFMIRPTGSTDPIVLQRTGSTGRVGFKKNSIKALTLDNVAVGVGPRQRHERALVQRKRRYQDQATIKLYTLKARVAVPVKLEFVNTITKTVETNFRDRMLEAMTYAVQTS